MEKAEFNLIRSVEGLPSLRKAAEDRQARQGKQQQEQEQEQSHEESESPLVQQSESLEISDPDTLDENLRGDDPHTIDYRA